MEQIGDARGEMPKASSVFEASTARLRLSRANGAVERHRLGVAVGDSVEIWAGTQSQSIACEAPAKVLGIARDKVKLHDMLMVAASGGAATATSISSSTRCCCRKRRGDR